MVVQIVELFLMHVLSRTLFPESVGPKFITETTKVSETIPSATQLQPQCSPSLVSNHEIGFVFERILSRFFPTDVPLGEICLHIRQAMVHVAFAGDSCMLRKALTTARRWHPQQSLQPSASPDSKEQKEEPFCLRSQKVGQPLRTHLREPIFEDLACKRSH